MLDYTRRDFEFTMLYSLDDLLLKISEELDETFNPKKKESIGLLKTFRTLMETRRKWAREYKLFSLPESTAVAKPENQPRTASAKTAASARSLPQTPKSLSELAMEDVVNSFSKRTVESTPVPRGLLAG